jgi:hypothetical protein
MLAAKSDLDTIMIRRTVATSRLTSDASKARKGQILALCDEVDRLREENARISRRNYAKSRRAGE